MRTIYHSSVVIFLCAAAVARAGVRIAAGPGGDPASPNGVQNPGFPVISNAGTAVSSADQYVNGSYAGTRDFRTPFGGSPVILATIATAGSPIDVASAINDAGIIVGGGSKGDTAGSRATRFLTPTTTLPVQLGTLGTSSTGYADAIANAINKAGVTVGSSTVFQGPSFGGTHAVRWNAAGSTPTDLGALSTTASGFSYSSAQFVNDAGTIGGYSLLYDRDGNDTGSRAVRWAAGSNTPVELGILGTDPTLRLTSSVSDMNAAGTIVGITSSPLAGDLGDRPVRWDAGGTAATELAVLGVDADGLNFSSARAINDTGDVVGTGNKYDANHRFLGSRPIRWSAGSTVATELGLLGTSPDEPGTGEADDVNRIGTIAGASGSRAVIWLPGSNTPTDLTGRLDPASGWTLLVATHVSDSGFVSGLGSFDPDGAAGPSTPYARSFVLLDPAAGTYGQGDADFDTDVDFSDLLLLAKHYGQASGGSVNAGDLNLDGITDFADLLSLAKHYGSVAGAADLTAATTPAFASDFALAQSLVPEPTAACGLIALCGTRRRRR